MTTKIATIGLSLAALTAGFGCASADHGEASVTPPADVHAAIVRAAGGHPIERVTKEDENGTVVYEAEFRVDGVCHSVTADADGNLLEEETDVKVADLPAAVSAAVLKAQPLARAKEASMVKKGGQSYYEVDAKVGSEKHELAIAADGNLISDKTEADEHDGEAKHGHADTD